LSIDTDLPVDTREFADTESGLDTTVPMGTETPSDTGGPTDSEHANDTEDSAVSTDSDSITQPTYADECEESFASALVCTGFEDGIPLDTYVRDGDVETTSSYAFTGLSSLHAYTTDENSFANVIGAFDPIISGTIHFRAYYYIPVGTLVGLIKVAAFEGWDESAERDQLNVDVNVVQGGRVEMFFQSDDVRIQSEAGVVPEGAWFCLHGSLSVSETAGVLTLGINGTPVLTSDEQKTLPPSGISRADFGIGWTQDGQVATDVYVDNIVVDTSPVPCI
jgi:hypothetical protein